MKGQRFQRARARTMSRARTALNRPALEHSQVSHECLVLATEIVRSRHEPIAGRWGEPIADYYSIAFERPDGEVPLLVVTRNEAIYKLAAAAEGWAYVRFTVTWRPTQRIDGSWINQLEQIVEVLP